MYVVTQLPQPFEQSVEQFVEQFVAQLLTVLPVPQLPLEQVSASSCTVPATSSADSNDLVRFFIKTLLFTRDFFPSTTLVCPVKLLVADNFLNLSNTMHCCDENNFTVDV